MSTPASTPPSTARRDALRSLALRVVGRLVRSAFVVWLAMTLVFFGVHAVGDPAQATLGAHATAQQMDEFRHRHGLDVPLADQYARFLGGAVRLDLGRSWRDDRPVIDVLATRLPRTLLLMAFATLFELALGGAVGVIAALRRGTALDAMVMSLAFLGVSTPSFFFGVLALQVVAFRLGWFPVGGYGVDALDHVRHALLPALVLASLGAATYARVLRSELIDVLQQDHVRTARAKGLPTWRVVLVHGVRNALPPVVTLLGLSLPSLVAGAVVTETVFAWPGMGRLASESIFSFDLPMLLGIVLLSAVTVQLGNLVAELVNARLDPRLR